jgi:hypothetical protein
MNLIKKPQARQFSKPSKPPISEAMRRWKMSHKAKIQAAVEDLRKLEKARARRLRLLCDDDAFVLETEKIKVSLMHFRKSNSKLFNSIFPAIGYGNLFRPKKLKTLVRKIKDPKMAAALRDYINYASRFQVLLLRTKRSFRVVPIVPFPKMYHMIIKGGQLKALRDELSGETEPVFEDVADDAVDTPQELTALLDNGKAKVIQVDDWASSSVLNELEAVGYSADALTFILHHTGHQKFIYCLVGERVSTAVTWRLAGKVIKALQKSFYGRPKAGRPANVSRTKKAIRLLRQKKRSFKEKAYELTPKEFVDSNLETQLRYFRAVRTKLR